MKNILVIIALILFLAAFFAGISSCKAKKCNDNSSLRLSHKVDSPKVRYLTVRIVHCTNLENDTIKIKAVGSLCIGYTRVRMQKTWVLCDKEETIFAKNVCDYEVLRIEDHPYED